MTRGMGVFGSEGWSECVTVSHSYGIGLNVKLSRHTEKSWFAEHIVFVVNYLVLKRDGFKVKELFLFHLLDCFFLLALFILFLIPFLGLFLVLNCLLYIHTPIITASDCEGAGEMFQVTNVLPEAHEPITKIKKVEFNKIPKSEEEKKAI
jgi:hypothetical protein